MPCKHPFENHIPATGGPCLTRARNVALKHTALVRQKIHDTYWLLVFSNVHRVLTLVTVTDLRISQIGHDLWTRAFRGPGQNGDEDIRIVGDFHALNQYIIKEHIKHHAFLHFKTR